MVRKGRGTCPPREPPEMASQALCRQPEDPPGPSSRQASAGAFQLLLSLSFIRTAPRSAEPSPTPRWEEGQEDWRSPTSGLRPASSLEHSCSTARCRRAGPGRAAGPAQGTRLPTGTGACWLRPWPVAHHPLHSSRTPLAACKLLSVCLHRVARLFSLTPVTHTPPRVTLCPSWRILL